MTKLSNITHRALCAFRKASGDTFAIELAIATAAPKGSDDKAIHLHKAVTAAQDFYAASDELGTDAATIAQVAAFAGVWPRDEVEELAPRIIARAEVAYDRAEAKLDDVALSSFHEAAFGDAA